MFHPLSFIFYPSSFILHPLSFLIYSSSFISFWNVFIIREDVRTLEIVSLDQAKIIEESKRVSHACRIFQCRYCISNITDKLLLLLTLNIFKKEYKVQ